MDQKSLSDANRKAWNYRTAEAYNRQYGTPKDFAAKLLESPGKHLWRIIDFLGQLEGARIINLMGSNGKKAIPLALLGAGVTVVDISEANREYALALAAEAGVHIDYICADILDLDTDALSGTYDVVLMELGIMHYFLDLAPVMTLVSSLLKPGGRYVLNEGHPIKKCIRGGANEEPRLEGDYFDTTIVESSVAYASMLDDYEASNPPMTRLRKWTLGEIVTAVADAGLIIRKLTESPGFYEYLPGHFTLLATK